MVLSNSAKQRAQVGALEIVKRGNLLEDVMTYLKDAELHALTATEPGEAQRREECYQTIRGLDMVKQAIENLANEAKAVIEKDRAKK